ncbi:RNA polymerase sigma factor SigA [Aquisphaera giovannonii]|uniref:RNA polymerase sigma factor SigA n=1 Tax=Aquisphaera giovannonii TaxID=406548 RepID=A0A5B9WF98_9BACT|nr:sigma-70 family RNA polymerase sigma factor [Aquisphaera giovannonii]QEH38631.1 RNA polymerase sigma factor SigA [Aquisphaera giovannonii]
MAMILNARPEATVRRPFGTKRAGSGDASPSNGGRCPDHVPSLLDKDEEGRLAARVKSGDREARDALIAANLGLVVHIVRGFRCDGMTIEDLRQEGTCGLIRAAELYDPARHHVRFGAYAASWIRRYVQRAVGDNLSLIRLPRYLVDLHGRCQRQLSDPLPEPPSETGLPSSDEHSPSPEAGFTCPGQGEWDLEVLANRLHLSVRRLRSVVSSIKTQTGWSIAEGEDSGQLEEMVIDPHRPDLEAEKAEANSNLRRAVHSLTRLEARVIKCRFRLEGAARPSRRHASGKDQMPTVMKYSEISRLLGIGPARVRAILFQALEKLRERLIAMRDEDDPLPGRRVSAA